MRTHLKPQSREERRQRRASSPPLPPSWERSLGPRHRGSPAGAGGARGAQHPGSGIPGGVRTSARSASLGSAGPAGVCAPSPAPQRRFTPLPRARSGGGPGGSARPRPSAAPRRARLQPAPLRTAQRCRGGAASGGMLPGGGGSRALPCRATHLRGGRGGPRVAPEERGPGGCDPQHPGLGRGGVTLSRAPGGDALPGESLPAPPRGRPGPRCPHSTRTMGPLRPGRGCGPAARNSRSRQSRGN